MDQAAIEAFHRARRMFCVKDGKLMLAPAGVPLSHLEWFQREGWVGNGNGGEEEFFRHIVRGYYLPEDHALYFFKEADFSVHDEIADAVTPHLLHLKEMLGLKPDTEVFLGPKNSDPTEKDRRQKRIGTIGTLLKRAREKEEYSEETIR